MMRLTHPAKGGKLNEMDCPRLNLSFCLFYLSGSGTTGKLRCPAASTARTPNISLSFETFSVARVLLLTNWAYSQSAALVERQTTSYAVAPADGSHVNVVSFSRFFVSNFAPVGGAGDDANDASVAAVGVKEIRE